MIKCPVCKATLKLKDDNDRSLIKKYEYELYYSYEDDAKNACISHRITTGPFNEIRCGNCLYLDVRIHFENLNDIFNYANGVI